ncbi:transcriptional antiterminator, BglG [Clostridium sp. DL-VIII]|uniref:BglG family transcription antiterminator LicT n=1 Tax=Clostridium sp. DL-VIII TaxID=641107 RepID=UPI00023B00C7|nr:PRD domain-containing protein [Clostridium sp. DL-VIII]EHI99176.1 transcriptional antiterminator, BglG [Clostridium sp. DL-VIII]
MIIHKILNNNAVLSHDKNGKEIIITGKGISYQCKNGDTIKEERIEKTFKLNANDTNRRFQQLILDIPLDCIDTSEEIISMIKSNIGKKINDSIYVTLTDHISNTIERHRMGVSFDNSILWDVKRMYKEEYELGLKAVEIIRKNFDINIDNSEANFIALHIVNAEFDTELPQIYSMTKLIQAIADIVEDTFKLDFDSDDIAHDRFMLHLKFFIQRVINGVNMAENKNLDLLNIMEAKYPKQYKCAEKIKEYIKTQYKYTVGCDEMLYLTIHITRITTNS